MGLTDRDQVVSLKYVQQSRLAVTGTKSNDMKAVFFSSEYCAVHIEDPLLKICKSGLMLKLAGKERKNGNTFCGAVFHSQFHVLMSTVTLKLTLLLLYS